VVATALANDVHTAFNSLGVWIVARRRLVLAVWAVLFVLGLAFAPRIQEVFGQQEVSAGTGESAKAARVITEKFGSQGAFSQILALHSDDVSVDDPRYAEAARSLLDAARATGVVSGTYSFFENGDRSLVAEDGRTTYAYLDLSSQNHEQGVHDADKLLGAVKRAPKPPWLSAYVTGQESVSAETIDISEKSLLRAEIVGFPVALVVLVFVFGALVAAGLPLLMGLLAVLLALAGAFVLGHVVPVSVFVQNIASMIGLGVGIDYSLFALNRFRYERRMGRDSATAAVATVTHAGKAVAFSGLTVMIGLSALLVPASSIIRSVAMGGIMAVLVAVLAALTLLPAMLVYLSDWIERPHRLTRLLGRLGRAGFWHGWAMGVMKRPAIFIVLGLAALIALAAPATGMRTGSIGVKMLGSGAQSRLGYDLLAEAFGGGRMGPVQVVVQPSGSLTDPATIAAVHELSVALEADPRVEEVRSYAYFNPDWTLADYQRIYAAGFDALPEDVRGSLARLVNLASGADTALVIAFPYADPESKQADSLVADLRADIIPSIGGLHDGQVLVGGPTATERDQRLELYNRFPLVVAVVLAATFVLLTILFRSLVIPAKAVLMNLLSLFAAYGFLVLVFQHGYGDELLGFSSVGFVSWITPVTLFCILFGLSMDYEVFLLSRVREFRDRGLGTRESVAMGLERTGGVISGAALIMIVVFGAFALSPLVVVKEMGLGLAAAVLLDATIIRVLLVPSLMRVLGPWNWWLPTPLAKVLPAISLETEEEEVLTTRRR
jgi:RND superfamily putative drug exporter